MVTDCVTVTGACVGCCVVGAGAGAGWGVVGSELELGAATVTVCVCVAWMDVVDVGSGWGPGVVGADDVVVARALEAGGVSAGGKGVTEILTGAVLCGGMLDRMTVV